jgi:hypothetical protein
LVLHGVRGVGAHWVVGEEAAFMPRTFISRVIIPLLGVASSAGVFISTIDNDDDPFADMLLTPQPDGTFIMNVINYNLLVCQFCMKHGRTECEHSLSQMPRWLDTTKGKQLQRLFPEAEYEFQGVSGKGNTMQAFNPEDIKIFFDGPKHKNTVEPPLYIIGIDPSAGGESSNWGIVTIYQDPLSDFLVVSVYITVNFRRPDLSARQLAQIKSFDNEPIPRAYAYVCVCVCVCVCACVCVYGCVCVRVYSIYFFYVYTANKPAMYRTLVRKHILRLRDEHGGNNVKIVIGMESNLGYLTAEVEQYLKRCDDVCSNLHFIYESPSKNKKKLNVGIWTRNETKNAMYNIAERYLSQGAIKFDANLLKPQRVLNPDELTHTQEFMRQMMQYEMREVVDCHGNTKTFLHGKRDGRKDDLISAFGMALLSMHLIYTSKQQKYRHIIQGS